MGYPMTWRRVCSRNKGEGGYENGKLAGDLRRLEEDQRDPVHLAGYAKRAGITPEQAGIVLCALFDSTATDSLHDHEYQELYEALPRVRELRAWESSRCSEHRPPTPAEEDTIAEMQSSFGLSGIEVPRDTAIRAIRRSQAKPLPEL